MTLLYHIILKSAIVFKKFFNIFCKNLFFHKIVMTNHLKSVMITFVFEYFIRK